MLAVVSDPTLIALSFAALLQSHTMSIDFRIEARSGAARGWPPAHATWRDRNPCVHACGNGGNGESCAAGCSRRTRRPDSSRQYLPSLFAAGSRDRPKVRRAPWIYVVAARDPYRFRRLSGFQPERTAQSHRRRRHVSLASGRLITFLQPGEFHGGPDRHWAPTSSWHLMNARNTPQTWLARKLRWK